MEVQTYVEALREEGSAMADCARDHLGIPIPCCPGWDMAELLEHLGQLHHGVCELVRRRALDPDDIDDPIAPTTGLVQWFERGIDDLAAVFLEVPPTEPVWSWARDHSVRFWMRRIAIETAVHRWDAEAAVSNPSPIAPGLAADGIDEFFTLEVLDDPEFHGSGEALHLHSVDAPGEWSLLLTASGPKLSKDHCRATSGARATASDLLLLLWRRLPPSAVETYGDMRLMQRFLDRADLS